MRWRMLLSEFEFDVIYRRGKMNAAPDALSRVYCRDITRGAQFPGRRISPVATGGLW